MQITIPSWQQGGTLSQLAQKYNTTVAELMRLNPQIKDPNKIQEGATLNVPELAGTLQTGGGAGTTAQGKELPETGVDRLTSFRDVLKQMSNLVGRESSAVGMEKLGGLGLEPSKVSGATMGGLAEFIRSQTTTPISDIYKSTIDLLNEQQQRAQKQLELLISSDGIADLTDQALAKLSNMSGMDYEYLTGIRSQKQKEKKSEVSFWTGNIGGEQVRIGFDKTGKEVSRTVLGKAGEGGTWEQVSTTLKESIVNWMTAQPGFTFDKVKQLDEDPDFATFIRQKYNEAKAKAAEGLEEWPY